jgi:hypothetical protein
VRRQTLRDLREFFNDLRIPGAAHGRFLKAEREKET